MNGVVGGQRKQRAAGGREGEGRVEDMLVPIERVQDGAFLVVVGEVRGKAQIVVPQGECQALARRELGGVR